MTVSTPMTTRVRDTARVAGSRTRGFLAPFIKALIVSLLVVVITFLLGKAVLGDPGRLILGRTATQNAVDEFNRELGVDQPLVTQFVEYLFGLLRGDLGQSYAYVGSSVWDIVAPGLAISIQIATAAVLCSAILAIALGVLAATTRSAIVDHIIRTLSLVALSTPGPFVGLVLILVFATGIHLFPAGGWADSFTAQIPYMVLPVAALTIGLTPVLLRIVRERVLVQLEEPHVEASIVRGLSWNRVLFRHVLPNCAGPFVIVLAMNVGALLSGAVVVEVVFGLPGLGRVLNSAVGASDIPVLQAVALITGILVTLCNVAADLAQRLIDPRLRK